MTQLPSAIVADEHYGMPTTGMAPGLALLFNDRLYERCKDVARIMAEARGFTPPHLLNNVHACFGVVQMSITWRLTPQLVAASTYSTPGGKIGYEGKLVQAILENSGRLEGGVEYELIGDWNKIRGRIKKGQSSKGNEIWVQDWKTEDEQGLGVVVRAKVKGEQAKREMEPFMLASCWPRNSTLWTTRPEQQIKYTACRAFANTVAPGILMGVPFDSDADQGTMIDVTPSRPTRSDFDEPRKASAPADHEPQPEPEGFAAKLAGEMREGTALFVPPTEEEKARLKTKHSDNPMPEFSAADAFEMGREARKKGTHRKATPPEWRNPEGETFIAAWLEGWDAQNTDQADARAGAER